MPRVPTEKDFEILLQDAEKSGVLDDVVKEKKELVNNPLSYLRFDPGMGLYLRIAEKPIIVGELSNKNNLKYYAPIHTIGTRIHA